MRTANRRNMIHNRVSLGFIVLMCFVLLAARKLTPVKRAPVAADREFATKAATAGMFEVKLGDLATSKGNHPAMREFGKRIVEDHAKAYDELNSIALQVNVTLPTGLLRSGQATYDRLSKFVRLRFR